MRTSDENIRLPISKPIHQVLVMLQANEYVRSGTKPSMPQLMTTLLDEACEARGLSMDNAQVKRGASHVA